MMLGVTPSPSTDTYIGDATYVGSGNWTYTLPPYTYDFKFYLAGIDKADNIGVSTIQQYYYAGDALLTLDSSNVSHALDITTGGVLKVI